MSCDWVFPLYIGIVLGGGAGWSFEGCVCVLNDDCSGRIMTS